MFRRIYAETAYLKESLLFKGNHLSSTHAALSYIRIPRSGSTAVSKALLERQFPELGSRALSASQINFLTDVHLRSTICSDDRKNLFFTVVRDPFARIASVYNQFFVRDDKPFLYEDYLFGILKRNLSFPDFVKTVMHIPDALKDQHLKPQHRFLQYYDENKIDVTVLKLEHPEMMRKFFLEHGIWLEHVKNPYDYRELYDAETLQNVYSIYKSDVSRFGYHDIFQDLTRYF